MDVHVRLDNHATVAEMLEAPEKPRVIKAYANVHYLACDVKGGFVPYTRRANQRLLNRTLAPLRRALPPGAVDLVATYPDQLRCR